jgi:hypothetical protein
MSRDFKVSLVILLALFIGVIVSNSIPRTDGRQQTNMEVAHEEIPRVEAILQADQRFKDVKAYVYTGQDGAVGLMGTVKKDEHLFALMKAVAGERLRVAVSWQVKVLANE